ncbi:MAG: cytochrome c maturation protein CcmE [Propionivibrio sp.]|uniref:Cytochrome c-type biogenesis protein CcmE n=1 Tax=Candidatus Propionivibrio dominans TaxID=2954373 RepID=A0A9D7F5S3_9RHOO|nr:cytochrome c maturation protein CcmE [Propionivibrio sp.]MBK7422605.1 cytochrome c maturation protein CcmE [Candidatus Propionivibrio dominans]MBK8893101.1 cytochrome c maturation protein CcmE [Propionivibrio sp.]MBL0165714.1 cytochrome c maturation protein CcmE [Propionivibrio sp.]
MKPRQKRMALIVGGLITLGVSTALVMNALNSNIAFFFSPTEAAAGKAPQNKAFRIGGMVKEGSIRRDNLTVHFTITDTAKEVPVSYTGILPDLFKEGKGAVAQGRINPDGTFAATEVLAKHDENYMPPEAQYALDEASKASTKTK